MQGRPWSRVRSRRVAAIALALAALGVGIILSVVLYDVEAQAAANESCPHPGFCGYPTAIGWLNPAIWILLASLPVGVAAWVISRRESSPPDHLALPLRLVGVVGGATMGLGVALWGVTSVFSPLSQESLILALVGFVFAWSSFALLFRPRPHVAAKVSVGGE